MDRGRTYCKAAGLTMYGSFATAPRLTMMRPLKNSTSDSPSNRPSPRAHTRQCPLWLCAPQYGRPHLQTALGCCSQNQHRDRSSSEGASLVSWVELIMGLL